MLPSSSFVSSNKDTNLNFSLKLVDTNNKIIKFIEGEKKFAILEFIIKFLK